MNYVLKGKEGIEPYYLDLQSNAVPVCYITLISVNYFFNINLFWNKVQLYEGYGPL